MEWALIHGYMGREMSAKIANKIVLMSMILGGLIGACQGSQKKSPSIPSPQPVIDTRQDDTTGNDDSDDFDQAPESSPLPAPSPGAGAGAGNRNAGQACASFCENIPESVFSTVPSCNQCSRSTSRPGIPGRGGTNGSCADFCSSVPRIAQPFVPQCSSCSP
jgi:hypothetical protein